MPTLSGAAGTAAGDSDTITVKIFSGSTPTGTPVQTLTATTNAGVWSVVAAPALAQGEYTVQSQQVDAVGNTGLSTANTFVVDTTAPAVTVAAPANGSASNSTRPTLSGAAGTAAGDSSTITVKIFSGPSSTGTPVQTLTTTASAAPGPSPRRPWPKERTPSRLSRPMPPATPGSASRPRSPSTPRGRPSPW